MGKNLEDWRTKYPDRVRCGGCKATGVEMKWNDQAELVPVEPKRVCQTCNGTGWVSDIATRHSGQRPA